ncbi:unnamed protein product, partial [Gongylonema pulchrum]|uniref:Uncharacterized protein n=1 Tax=Gongylonema pulchrum TaxID=637853 RepID=A0A183F1N1_9BILA
MEARLLDQFMRKNSSRTPKSQSGDKLRSTPQRSCFGRRKGNTRNRKNNGKKHRTQKRKRWICMNKREAFDAKIFQRPISLLYPLEVNEEDISEDKNEVVTGGKREGHDKKTT